MDKETEQRFKQELSAVAEKYGIDFSNFFCIKKGDDGKSYQEIVISNAWGKPIKKSILKMIKRLDVISGINAMVEGR